MAKVNIYAEHIHDDGYPDTHLEGWFDPDTAHRFAEGTNFTGSQRGHEALYRTSGGDGFGTTGRSGRAAQRPTCS